MYCITVVIDGYEWYTTPVEHNKTDKYLENDEVNSINHTMNKEK